MYTKEELETFTYRQLQKLCKQLNLKANKKVIFFCVLKIKSQGIRHFYQRYAKLTLTFQSFYCSITFRCLILSVMSFYDIFGQTCS